VDGITSIAFDLLSFSAIMVLVVMGLGIIASMMGIFNFAHGEFLLFGAYTVYLTHALGHPVWLAWCWRRSPSRSSASSSSGA